ncbi:uncharacterized protein I206_101681 [Kwoniella pini CBS 10737]|uniref:Uncharacterized protein n=1 Tax=Kwoniella pini CBS 10737 TaxID=1296096 RepID=A0A1B9HW06_9TREE|nr:uncharacterized protein I206_06350 [Kwoniella pini CBS 10737]OCF47449.1 hypothetical protein I206_06350 [Kwoniella pini CBS 10737]
MESLSPECTPLKHKYDSCFNAWFEGYLQPALSSEYQSSSTVSSDQKCTANISTSTTQIDIQNIPESSSSSSSSTSTTTNNQNKQRKSIITSWSSSFPSTSNKRIRNKNLNSNLNLNEQPKQEEYSWFNNDNNEGEEEEEEFKNNQIGLNKNQIEIDIRGKSKSQIKAEEYQRNCGKFWEDYQGCLKKAIIQNESLSSLLETAREEHPLGNLDGLKGTPWDSNVDFTKQQE